MANHAYPKRRDSKHRVLRRGESIRKNGKYQFKYHVNGKAKFVYSWRLEPTDKLPPGKKPCLSLRELEKQIGFDLDSLTDPTKKNITVMELVERYIATRTFLKFVHDDNNYCRYYEAVYILFHTGMRISEFCGLTISDLDMENRIIDINHQLQRTSAMEYYISSTKTNAGTRRIPMTEGVYRCFQAILEDREAPKVEKMIDGYTGFLYLDDKGMPEVAMHWEHRFRNMVNRYNDIYRVQMPSITPHICRHTYCSNQAKAGMNPKTLQYLMGHSDIGVTLNTYTHLGLEDAAAEMARMEGVEAARREQQKVSDEGAPENRLTQKMFRVV